jgi:hypothetical protein
MLGSALPHEYYVKLAYTATIAYLEYCNTFIYSFRDDKTTPALFTSAVPTWITLMNYNPITEVNGYNFMIKTS